MAKTSLVVKQKRPQKLKMRAYTALQQVRPPARGVQEVRPLPDLPARAGPQRRDSRA